MRIETPHGVEHSSVRIYVFNCTYPDLDTHWQDDPQPLLIVVRDKLDRIEDFNYKTIKICGVRKTLVNEMEIHIDGVEYYDSDRLSATDTDLLRSEIQNAFNEIGTLSYSRIDVVADCFLDNPTVGYIDQSMSGAD